MKENSIERDITLIEKSLCDKDTIIQYHYWVGIDFLNAVERIVADYKIVLKENEELKEDRDKFKKALGRRITYCNELEKDLFENSSNYVIKKQKVKDKIEELKEAYEDSKDENGESEYYYPDYTIRVLEELLEKRK